jgi:hypothetical protein
MQDQDETKAPSDETKTSQKKNREVLSLEIPEGVKMRQQVEQIQTRQRNLSSSPSDSLGRISLSSRTAIPQAADDAIDKDDATISSSASISSSAIPRVATTLLQLAQGKSDSGKASSSRSAIPKVTTSQEDPINKEGHTEEEQKVTEEIYNVATIYPTDTEDPEIMGTAVNTIVLDSVTFKEDEEVYLKHDPFPTAVYKIVIGYEDCYFSFFEWKSRDKKGRPYIKGWNTHFPLALTFPRDSDHGKDVGFGTRRYIPWSDHYLVGEIIPRDRNDETPIKKGTMVLVHDISGDARAEALAEKLPGITTDEKEESKLYFDKWVPPEYLVKKK